MTFDDTLFDATNTTQVGKVLAVCTRVGTSPTLFHCDVTVAIAKDTLAPQGAFDAATAASTFAVTGGTGRYTRARGEVIVRPDPASPDEVILQFRLI